MILLRILFFLIYMAIALILAPIFSLILVFSTVKDTWKALGSKWKKEEPDVQDSQLDKDVQEVFTYSNSPKYWKNLH